MRKILVVLAAAALLAAPLAPAEASTKYKIAVSVYPKLLDVSKNHTEKTRISGKVTGGRVKGKSVHIWAVNIDHGGRGRDLGVVKLSSRGTFSTSWRPPRGGRWTFKVVKRPYGSIRMATNTSSYVDAYEWADISEFYDGGASNTPEGTPMIGKLTRAGRNLEYVGGQRWSTEYFIHGGSSAGFDTTGYRCKKITMHIGVSDKSEASKGIFRIRQNGRQIGGHEQRKGQAPDKRTRDYDPRYGVDIAIDPSDGYDPADVRFISGNPKVFCTYPFS